MRAIAVVGLLCMASVLFAEEITMYRTIVAQGDSTEALASYLTPEREIVEYRGQFVVVDGWYENFEDAMPSKGLEDEWNKRWKHVYPVDVTQAEAGTRGFSVPELKSQAILRKRVASPDNFASRLQRSQKIDRAIQAVRTMGEQEGITTRQLVERLKPEYEALAVQAADGDGPNAEKAQLWLAKAFYMEGLAASKERLPNTHGNIERHAWPEEELAYDSALAEYKRFLGRFPNSEHAENVAYHIAATQYHLTYRGHHRHQVEKAKKAYEDFIEAYPNSERVPRAYLNLLGITLELARMDDTGFEDVISRYEELAANYPEAGSYVTQRAKLIAAEAYFDGDIDYLQTIAFCDELLNQDSVLNDVGVFGTAVYQRGLAKFVTSDDEGAVLDFTLLIDFYQSPEYHFNYKVEEIIAGAYAFRSNSFMLLGLLDQSIMDAEKIIKDYPDSRFIKDAHKTLDMLTNSAILKEVVR